MKLKPIGPNQNAILIERKNHPATLIFFSYKTPVAAIVDGHAYRTEKFWSVTTSKHITRWLRSVLTIGVYVEEKPQGFFDNLAENGNEN